MFDLEKTEKTIMNLFGLLTAIKSSAENLSRDIDIEQLDKHIESVTELCDISREKLTDVWESVSDIETADEIETESEIENKAENTSETKPLADMISAVLKHPDTPDELFSAVIDGLDEVADLGRFKTLRKLESSPEYISKILSDYGEAQTK